MKFSQYAIIFFLLLSSSCSPSIKKQLKYKASPILQSIYKNAHLVQKETGEFPSNFEELGLYTDCRDLVYRFKVINGNFLVTAESKTENFGISIDKNGNLIDKILLSKESNAISCRNGLSQKTEDENFSILKFAHGLFKASKIPQSNHFTEHVEFFGRKENVVGNTFSIVIRNNRTDFSHLLKSARKDIKKILTEKGLQYVGSTIDSAIVAEIGFFEQFLKGDDKQSPLGIIYLMMYTQKYGKKASKYFVVSKSFNLDSQPTTTQFKNVIREISKRLSLLKINVSKDISALKAGCEPYFGFNISPGEVHMDTISKIFPKSPFEKQGLKIGDKIISVDAIPFFQYMEENRFNNISASDNLNFVFKRKGKKFSVVISPQINCTEWLRKII